MAEEKGNNYKSLTIKLTKNIQEYFHICLQNTLSHNRYCIELRIFATSGYDIT